MHLIVWLVLQVMRPILWPLTRLDHAQQEFFRGLGKGGWTLTQGHVVNVDLRNTGYMWRVTVAYSYSVAGELRSGSTFQLFLFQRESRNYSLLYPLGTPLMVRYDPLKTEKSVVLGDDQLPT
jgi:hypothetical protein